MHGRKASNPVLRLRIEETSVIKNLKTDNVKNTRPSSRGMMGFHSPNNRFSHGNNGDDNAQVASVNTNIVAKIDQTDVIKFHYLYSVGSGSVTILPGDETFMNIERIFS